MNLCYTKPVVLNLFRFFASISAFQLSAPKSPKHRSPPQSGKASEARASGKWIIEKMYLRYPLGMYHVPLGGTCTPG